MLWTSIFRPIFDNENIENELNSWNRKLFIVELVFHIFLNHSIPISESKVMVNTHGLSDHTKSDEPKNSNLIFDISFWGPFLTMKTFESSLIR